MCTTAYNVDVASDKCKFCYTSNGRRESGSRSCTGDSSRTGNYRSGNNKAEEKEVPEEEAEEPVEEAALVPEESTAENQENETSEATNTVDTYIEDGLYEENGEVYYYKDGEMVTNKIVEFEAEDGTTFAHYFDYDGTMLKNAYHYYVSGYDDNDDYFAGEIRVDDNGYLCTGWYSEDGYWRYYGEEDYYA